MTAVFLPPFLHARQDRRVLSRVGNRPTIRKRVPGNRSAKPASGKSCPVHPKACQHWIEGGPR